MYQDPVIQAYIDLLKANINGAIKSYWQGEPTRIAASDLPCAIISKRQTRIGPLTNAEDEHAIGMSITIISDVRQDLNTTDGAENAVKGVATLYDLIEGRNDDFTLKETSLLGILRGNQLVNPTYGLRTDLSTITLADYGLTLRDRNKEEWSIEGRVDIVAHFTQPR